MEEGDPGRLRQRDHSSSGGAGRLAVTRSITRSGSRSEGEAAGNVDAENIKGARNRLLDKLKTRRNDSEPPNSTSILHPKRRTMGKKRIFALLNSMGVLPRMRYKK